MRTSGRLRQSVANRQIGRETNTHGLICPAWLVDYTISVTDVHCDVQEDY